MKSSGVAYLLLFVGGMTCLCGLHRFYLNRPITGLIWLFTGGLLGIGQIVDLFLIPGMVAECNGYGYGPVQQTVTNIIHVNVEQKKKKQGGGGPAVDFDFS